MSHSRRHSLNLLMVIIAGFLAASPSAHAGETCRIENRSSDFVMENLPEEFEGWLNCGHESVKLNVIYFAKFPLKTPAKDRLALLALLNRYVDVVSPGEKKRVLIKETGSLDKGLWMEVESHREFGESTHFLFTAPRSAGETQVFLYTDTTEHARNQSGVIRSIRAHVTTTDFLKTLRETTTAK